MEKVKVEIQDGRIHIFSEMRDRELAKSIPGSRWSKDSRTWHVGLSWASCRQLRAVFGSRLEIGPELFKFATDELAVRVTPSMQLREAVSALDIPGMPGLYSYQKAGALWLVIARNALLGDIVGSGKTAQTIAAARVTNSLPLLVICPNSVVLNWKKELNTWWPEASVYVVKGTAAKRAAILAAAAEDSAAVVIINHEAARLHSRLARYGSIALTDKEKEPKELNQIPFKMVVVDEAHRLAHPKTQFTRAVWACGQNPSVERRIALTGTPVTSTPETLYPILHFLDPIEWPGKTAFIDRYCMTGFSAWGGLEVFGIKPDRDEEFRAIFNPRFRRMPKELVLPQLPPVVREQRTIEMAPKQRKAYNSMADSLFAETEDGGMLIAKNPISQLTRLVQYASATITLDQDGKAILSEPSPKIDQLMQDLKDLQGEPVVCFFMSRQLCKLASLRLEKANIPHSTIQGGQTADSRQQEIDSFQNGKTDVILAVLQAGSTGINLQRARVTIFVQKSWSQIELLQAEGRTHRIGSEVHPNVLYIDYLVEGTVEERMREVLEGKQELLEEIVKDRAAIQRLLKGAN